MTITEILNSEASASEKLSKISSLVSVVRKNYGNTDAAISVPEIDTVDGLMDFTMLSDESKLAIVKNESRRIKMTALEFGKSVEGANVKKKLEELIATSAILTNTAEASTFDYI